MQVEAWFWSVVWTCRVRVLRSSVICLVELVSPWSPRFIRGRFSALHADCMRADSICASLEHYWLSLIEAHPPCHCKVILRAVDAQLCTLGCSLHLHIPAVSCYLCRLMTDDSHGSSSIVP
jgi:hypothetical protein